MGIMIFGRHLFGSVDRVPGCCYVATMFFHIFFLPLIPLGTFIVLEGSETGNFFERTFQGPRVRLGLKSVLVGYFRGWVGVFTLFLFAISALIIPLESSSRANEGLMMAVGIGAVLSIGFATFWVLTTRGITWIMGEVPLHILSLLAWVLATQSNDSVMRLAAAKWQSGLLMANLGLVAYSLTRLLDRASRTRAMQLGEEIGMDAKTMERLLKVDEEAEVDYQDYPAASRRQERGRRTKPPLRPSRSGSKPRQRRRSKYDDDEED